MKKNFLISALFFAFFTLPSFATAGFEVGIGSGYVFYRDSDTKDRNNEIGDKNQSIIATDAAFLLPMNENLMFAFGGDSVFDLRWNGSNHVYLIDYAFLAGFRVYPNLGGLFASVDYALGRRTDFFSYEGEKDHESTNWGNGFKFSLGYDFSYHLSSFAPVLVASIKSMPRGGSRDNLFTVVLRLTKHK